MSAERQSPPRILVLSARGRGTGSELRARRLASALSTLGCAVCYAQPLPTLRFWTDMVLSLPLYLFAALSRHWDAVVAVKPYPNAVLPALLARRRGAWFVLDVDDLDFAYSRGAFTVLHRALQAPWPPRADLVTYHHPRLRAALKREFGVPPARLLEVPQGVDSSLLGRGAPRRILPRGAAGWVRRARPRGPLLGFPAHLNVACGLEGALRAFQLLRRKVPGARLLVLGGGPDEGRFRRLARRLGLEEAVFFTGRLSPSQVAAGLRACRLALVYYEGGPADRYRCSLKLREALALGVPTVAVAAGDNPRFARYVFLSGASPGSFAKTVERALRAGPKPSARAALRAQWTWEACARPLARKLRKQ